jgi:glycosyltransferase involved in cell wall biosynthesis
VFEKLGIKPRVIASGEPATLGFDADFRTWRLETENDELSQLGIGISPLPDTPWERGKCAVKVLQYMACGIPVVASPVGVHNQIVCHGVNGFLAAREEDWVACLSELLADPKLRARLGQAGRDTVSKRFTVEHAAAKVADVLRSVSRS